MRIVTRSLVLTALVLVVPALAVGHPPAADPHAGCLQNVGQPGPAQPMAVVNGLFSYLAPLGVSLACPAVAASEWGSHAAACPPPGFVGPAGGVFCGPVIPAGGFATCSWALGANPVPVELVIGFEPWPFPAGVVAPPGPVYGTFPAGSWTVPNPFGVPARVMAFPTNMVNGQMFPGAWNWVGC